MITQEEVHQLALGLQHFQAVVRQIRDNIHKITDIYMDTKSQFNQKKHQIENEIERVMMDTEQQVPDTSQLDRYEEYQQDQTIVLLYLNCTQNN
jgi:hypothetical protein